MRILLGIFLLFIAACSDQSGKLLFVDAVDYAALEPANGCSSDPQNAIYHSCIDSELLYNTCLLYTSPSPRDLSTSRMPSSA